MPRGATSTARPRFPISTGRRSSTISSTGSRRRRTTWSAAYKDGEIVAFLANLPQRFDFEGKIYNAIYSCLLVVRKEYLRQGIALDLIRAAVALNKQVRLRFFAPDARDRAPLDADDGQAPRARGTGSSGSASPGSWPASSTSAASTPPKVSRATKRRPSGSSAPTGRRRPRPASTCANTAPRTSTPATAFSTATRKTVPPGPRLGQGGARRRARLSGRRPDPRLGKGRPRPGHGQLRPPRPPGQEASNVGPGSTTSPSPTSPPPSGRRSSGPTWPASGRTVSSGTIDFTKRGWPAGPFYRARFIPYPRAVNLVSWTFNPDISLAGIPVVYEIQV